MLVAILCSAFIGTIRSAEGDEITTISNIVDGKSYYIKGVRTSNTYYLTFTDALGSQSGTESTKKEDAILVTFHAVTGGYNLVTPNGYFIAPGTSNGKINVSNSAIIVSASNQNSKIRLSIVSGTNTWSIQKNTSAANFGGYKNTQTDITLIEGPSASAPTYTITAQSNDNNYGTVSVSNNTITATPASGYRVSTTNPYTITSGEATVSQNGNVFTVTATSDCNVLINFEAIPTYTVTWSINENNERTAQFEEGESIVFPDDIADVEEKKFVGWVEDAITGITDEEPHFITEATMGNTNITYYAVFADVEGSGEFIERLSQTLQYDTWSYSGTTKDMNSYRLFGNNSYVESSAFDLSTLSKVIVYAGTYGNLSNSNKKVTVKAGSTTWGTKTLSTNSATTENEITSSVSLSGTGTINIVSNGGDANNNGIRISKIEIFVKTLDLNYSNYCTTVAPDTRALVNMTAFSATATKLVKGNTTATTVTNDKNGWTAAYAYESDNTDVATVDANGVITAVAKGTANITATLNVDKNDADYKAGATKSMSVEITVVNPSHTVAFYNNGIKLSEAEVEEEDNITFPSNPTFGTFEFVGWASAKIEGSVAAAPATVTSATMGTENVNYYAVYGDVQKKNVTATFDASNISNLTSTATRTWKDNETGIELYISAGQRYTSGTPNTWTASNSTSSIWNYMSVSKENSQIKKVTVTISETNYAVDDYYAYAKADDEDGDELTSSVSTSGTTSTLILNNDYEQVVLFAGTNYQIRATVIEVEAVISATVAYYTTLAETANVTAAGWGTYVTKHDVEFEAGNAYVVTEADEKTTLVEVTEVPAGTPVLLKAAGTKTATFVATTPSAPATNLLHVSDGTIDADAGAYVLGNKNGQVGFYKWTGTALAAGKVYLLPTTNAREFIGFDDDSTTTGINSIDNGQQTYDNVYDLQGRRVAQPAKGMYIVNGKKVIK